MALAHRVDLRQANRIRMAGRRPVRVIMAISCRRARSGDLELNWGRIGHVTRKRMRHPCNLLANIIRTSWPTRWPGSPDLANFLRIGQRRWESGAFWGRAAGTATGPVSYTHL